MNEIIQFFLNKKGVILAALAVMVLIAVLIACYDKWIQIWHDFGANLYHLLHSD